MEQSADAVIERLKFALGVGTDAKLAGELGVSVTTVSNWRSRGGVPLKRLGEISKKFGVPLDYLFTGKLASERNLEREFETVVDPAIGAELSVAVFKLMDYYGYIQLLPETAELDSARFAAVNYRLLENNVASMLKMYTTEQNMTKKEAIKVIEERLQRFILGEGSQ